MVGSDGRTYRFLLQFAIPYWTRTDERTAQTYYIMDKFLRQDVVSARHYLSVQPTAAISVAQRLRMTPDPESRLALDEVLRRSCDGDENDGKPAVATFFLEEITRQLKDVLSPDASEEEKGQTEKAVRLKVYREICETMVDDRILLRYLQNALDGPEAFFLFRRAFAVHLASNSLLQYVFATCERTPQRFVILQSNARVLSPDFRVTYSNQGEYHSASLLHWLAPSICTKVTFTVVFFSFLFLSTPKASSRARRFRFA
jgi:transformation/transcription domain-associated protein